MEKFCADPRVFLRSWDESYPARHRDRHHAHRVWDGRLRNRGPRGGPETSEINFGLIPGGLPAGFYDDAEEHAGPAVERYIGVSDAITSAGATDISAMKALVSPEWWETERTGFSHFAENSLRTVGTSDVSRFLVQSARITPDDMVEVGAIACIDTTGCSIFPSMRQIPRSALGLASTL